MSRVVYQIRAARALAARPKCIPASRARGAKAQGLRYERLLAKALPAARHGQWWEFIDINGQGFCQTDLVLPVSGGLVVLEAKYTWTAEGHGQLENLYLPVVGKAMGRMVWGLVVARVLTGGEALAGVQVTASLDVALALVASGKRVVLHWLGQGPSGLGMGTKPGVFAPGLELGL